MKFLQNPKVTASPLSQKQDFLKRKGLTDREIQRACDLANLPQNSSSQNEYTAVTIQPPRQLYPNYYPNYYQSSLFFKVKEFFNVAALISTTAYCVYWFYKVKSYDLSFQFFKKLFYV